MRHLPEFDSVTVVCTGHIHAESRRTGTSGSLQYGHAPGFASRTSGWWMHVIEIGGSAGGAGVRPRCATAVAMVSATSAAVRMGFIRS
jgi:hypothetical protein